MISEVGEGAWLHAVVHQTTQLILANSLRIIRKVLGICTTGCTRSCRTASWFLAVIQPVIYKANISTLIIIMATLTYSTVCSRPCSLKASFGFFQTQIHPAIGNTEKVVSSDYITFFFFFFFIAQGSRLCNPCQSQSLCALISDTKGF